MRFHEHNPGPPLSRFVECLWYLETGNLAGPVQRIVPDGSMEIILHAAEPFAQLLDDRTCTQGRSVISGQLTGPIFVAPSRNARVFGIRFRPSGASAFFKLPIHRITDQLLPLDNIAPQLHCRLSSVIDERHPAKSFERLEAVLSAEIKPSRSSAQLEQALKQIEFSRGNISLDQLANDCSLSSRQLQRLFKDQVGIGPKLLCRLTRFRHVLNRLQLSPERWLDTAIDAGYYDQSHLLLDFRQFAAETPSFLLSPESDLAQHFSSRRAMSHFSKTHPA